MKSDSDEDYISSLFSTANYKVKSDIKTEKDLNIDKISGNSKAELEDNHECSAACSTVLDISLVSAAFQYYKYIKNKNVPLDVSSSSSNIWEDNNYTLIKETDCTPQPLDSTNDLEKTLSDLQMDSDLMSEWPKFNTDFLNLYNFFDEQLESNDSLGNQFTIHENEKSDQAIATFEKGQSDSKSFSNGSSESIQPETDYESLETRSAASKSSPSWSQQSENTGDGRSVLKQFQVGGYFPEELDYEPSEAGETEAKESDNEFYIDPLKEKESGSFSHYCSHVEVPENSAFQKRIEETGTPEEHIETNQDFISFFESNFESGTDKSSLENNYNGYFEYVEEDEDSESDSEHSFKRNSRRNRQVNDLETLHPASINSNVSKVSQLNTINEVMLYIGEQCKRGNVNEAIAVANRYFSISEEAVQLEIFKELFINIIDLIKSPVFPVGDARISKSLGDVMDLFHHSKLLNSDLSSLVVSECFGCYHAIQTGKEFLSLVQKIKVPVNSSAISSYVNTVIPSEVPSLELISFLEYVKYVCNLSCPQTLLGEGLERFSKQEEGSLPFGFFRLCKFLCSISSKEVDLNHLQNFIEFCIKNNSWKQISSFFRAWCSTDGYLISCLSRSFLFRPEDAGLFYKKLADEIYEIDDSSSYLVGILGQVGVCLMLEILSRKQYESAFDVLFTLHKRNINYLELQAGLHKCSSYLKCLPNFADVFVFPFTVAFAALDICLHLERFRDAYRVFESFSLQLPGDMDGKVKLKVRCRRFRYLLRLAKELLSTDPLKLGLQALHDISSVAEGFSLEELEDFSGEIQDIYNKYLSYAVNGCQLHTALELFKYSEGALKEMFVIHPQVLRGLFVAFAQNNKLDDACKFFSLEEARKVYNTEQWRKNSRTFLLEDVSPNAEFKIQLAEEDFGFKYSTESNSVKTLEKVLHPLTPESYVADSSHQLISDKIGHHSLTLKQTLLESCRPATPETTFLGNSDHQFSDTTIPTSTEEEQIISDFIASGGIEQEKIISDTVSRSIEQKQTLSDISVSRSIEQGQTISDFSVPRNTEEQRVISDLTASSNIEKDQIISDLNVSENIDQEQIISSSNLLSPNAHSDKTSCPTPDEKLAETDASENILTDFCSESPAQVISEKKKVCYKKKVFKSLGRFRSKNTISKIAKLKKKFNKVHLKKKPVTEKKMTVPTGTEKFLTETKNLLPGSSKESCSSKPCIIKNFQVTLKNSSESGASRVVSLGPEMKLAESKNTASVQNVPETVFQKIVLFLRSKVLLKCRDIQPGQQQEKANHLASLFIQSNVVGALDKKTMKLLNEFADGCI